MKGFVDRTSAPDEMTIRNVLEYAFAKVRAARTNLTDLEDLMVGEKP
jgi:hypothetical protein